MEINPISQSIPVDDFESKVFRLALTGTSVTPDNLQDSFYEEQRESYIKFKDRKRKNKAIFSWRELKSSKREQLED